MNDADNGNRFEPETSARRFRARQVLDDFLARRAAGDALSSDELLLEHVDLQAELVDELNKLSLIDRARGQAAGEKADSEESTRPGGTHGEFETALWLRCPHCQMRVEVVGDLSLDEMRCSACGQNFQLVGPRAGERTPQCIGRFELIDKLGMGSFGTVWRARDSKLDRHVALKIPRRLLVQPLEIEEVMREARVAAQLRHRHIVTVHEVGREGDNVYIVSDLIQGVTLDESVKSRPLTFRGAAELVRVVAEALQHAHKSGVVHRDLKPANILIDEEGEPHLTDFGLAKRVDEEIAMTLDGHILGTPAYMSPEQARGASHLCDCRSDVYSLGVILFQLLTSELPFRGNMSVLPHKVIHDEPPSPRRLNRYVPRDLETICLKCLEKDPAKRYQTAQRLADELDRFLKDEPIIARPVGPLDRSWRWCRRNRTVAALTSVALALLLAIAVLTTWGYFHERGMRHQIEGFANSQQHLLLFIRNSDTVKRAWEEVEQAAHDPRFIEALSEADNDPPLRVYREQLINPRYEQQWPRLREKLVNDPARAALQSWVNDRFNESDKGKVFAWFVQDAQGLQIARGPIGGDNVGQNYAWRTYFHGGERDYRDIDDYMKRAPLRRLASTRLSDDFRTVVTNEWVVAVSTPVVSKNRFLGVVGVFLYIMPPDQRGGAITQR